MADVVDRMWAAYARAHFQLEDSKPTELERAGMVAALSVINDPSLEILADRVNALRHAALVAERKLELLLLDPRTIQGKVYKQDARRALSVLRSALEV